MKKLVFIFLIINSTYLNAQLIKNPGFEQCDPSVNILYEFLLDNQLFWNNVETAPTGLGGGIFAPLLLTADGPINLPCSDLGLALMHAPRSGLGNGGFALQQTSGGGHGKYHEFCQGRTFPLIAGQEYIFEAWVETDNPFNWELEAYLSTSQINNFYQSYSDPTFTDNQNITHVLNPPPGTSNISPQISIYVPGSVNGYQKVTGCFTATENGEHFITIGNFTHKGTLPVYVHIDDLDLYEAPGPLGNVTSNFTLNGSVFCSLFGIEMNDLGSIGNEYSIEIINDATGITEFSTGWVPGNVPSNINLTTFVSQQGYIFSYDECYNIILQVSNGFCSETSQQSFCIESSPQVEYIGPDEPLCHGETINLSVVGANANSYTWSDGVNSVTTPNSSHSFPAVYNGGQNSQFSVIFTSTSGCTLGDYFNVNVHSPNNQPPILTAPTQTNYIMEPGEYLTLNFESLDSPEENVTVSMVNDFFSGNPWVIPTGGGGYQVQNGANSGLELELLAGIYAVGYYDFDIKIEDNNACNSEGEIYHFKVEVICPNCNLCEYYSDNYPGHNDLPPLTKAAECIEAGNGIVTMGNSLVVFRAGQIVSLEPGFVSGPNFVAEIAPATCSPEECLNCCDGIFTVDSDDLPNVFTPNNDLHNDFWYVYDLENPSCMYNAKRWYLDIKNRWGITVWDLESPENIEANYCCRFDGTYMYPNVLNGQYIPEAWFSIFNIPYWTGHANSGPNQGALVADGWYTAVLRFERCGHEVTFQKDILVTSYLAMDEYNGNNTSQLGTVSYETSEESIIEESLDDLDLSVFPSPTDGNIFIKYTKLADISEIKVYSYSGSIVEEFLNFSGSLINLSNLDKGVYFLKFTMVSGEIAIRKIIKS